MKKSLALSILFAFIVAVTPAVASRSLPVDINSSIDSVTGSGSFTAFGPAVDSGIICSTGEVHIIENHNHFVCADGSGEFTLAIKVKMAA